MRAGLETFGYACLYYGEKSRSYHKGKGKSEEDSLGCDMEAVHN